MAVHCFPFSIRTYFDSLWTLFLSICGPSSNTKKINEMGQGGFAVGRNLLLPYNLYNRYSVFFIQSPVSPCRYAEWCIVPKWEDGDCVPDTLKVAE